MVDIATLTGAQLFGLGRAFAGIMVPEDGECLSPLMKASVDAGRLDDSMLDLPPALCAAAVLLPCFFCLAAKRLLRSCYAAAMLLRCYCCVAAMLLLRWCCVTALRYCSVLRTTLSILV